MSFSFMYCWSVLLCSVSLFLSILLLPFHFAVPHQGICTTILNPSTLSSYFYSSSSSPPPPFPPLLLPSILSSLSTPCGKSISILLCLQWNPPAISDSITNQSNPVDICPDNLCRMLQNDCPNEVLQALDNNHFCTNRSNSNANSNNNNIQNLNRTCVDYSVYINPLWLSISNDHYRFSLPSCSSSPPLPLPQLCSPLYPSSLQYYKPASDNYFPIRHPAFPTSSALLSSYYKLKATERLYRFFPRYAADCLRKSINIHCSDTFTTCTMEKVTIVNHNNNADNFIWFIPVPHRPTRSVCDSFQSSCALLLAISAPLLQDNQVKLQDIMITNCSALGGDQVWDHEIELIPSDSNSTIMVDKVHGNSFPLLPLNYTFAITCPAPLMYVPVEYSFVKTIAGGVCSIPPFSVAYTADEWKNYQKILFVCSLISSICSVFLSLTWLVFSARRTQRYVVFFNLSVCYLSLLLFTASLVQIAKGEDTRDIALRNPFELKSQKDGGYCLFVAVSFHFSIMSAMGWWIIIAIDLWLNTIFMKKVRFSVRTNQWIRWGYYAYGLGMPITLVIAALSIEFYGGSPVVPWCFQDTRVIEFDRFWALFLAPMLFHIVLAFIFMLPLLIRLVVQERELSKMRSLRKKDYRMFLVHLRAFLFLFFFLFVFAYVIGFNINGHVNYDSFVENNVKFFFCVLVNDGDKNICGVRPKGGPDPVGQAVLIAVCFSCGFLCFLVYGSSREHFQLWWEFCKSGRIGKRNSSDHSGPRKSTKERRSTQGDIPLTSVRSSVTVPPKSPSANNADRIKNSVEYPPSSALQNYSDHPNTNKGSIISSHSRSPNLKGMGGDKIDRKENSSEAHSRFISAHNIVPSVVHSLQPLTLSPITNSREIPPHLPENYTKGDANVIHSIDDPRLIVSDGDNAQLCALSGSNNRPVIDLVIPTAINVP